MSRLLLDTHVLLWSVYKKRYVPRDIAEVIEDTGNEVLFSAASIWEIAIKTARRKVDFDVDPAEVTSGAIEMGFAELPVTAAAAAIVASLPPLHGDPFDRLLVAQAMQEPAKLYTVDRRLVPYSQLVTLFRPA